MILPSEASKLLRHCMTPCPTELGREELKLELAVLCSLKCHPLLAQLLHLPPLTEAPFSLLAYLLLLQKLLEQSSLCLPV